MKPSTGAVSPPSSAVRKRRCWTCWRPGSKPPATAPMRSAIGWWRMAPPAGAVSRPSTTYRRRNFISVVPSRRGKSDGIKRATAIGRRSAQFGERGGQHRRASTTANLVSLAGSSSAPAGDLARAVRGGCQYRSRLDSEFGPNPSAAVTERSAGVADRPQIAILGVVGTHFPGIRRYRRNDGYVFLQLAVPISDGGTGGTPGGGGATIGARSQFCFAGAAVSLAPAERVSMVCTAADSVHCRRDLWSGH